MWVIGGKGGAEGSLQGIRMGDDRKRRGQRGYHFIHYGKTPRCRARRAGRKKLPAQLEASLWKCDSGCIRVIFFHLTGRGRVKSKNGRGGVENWNILLSDTASTSSASPPLTPPHFHQLLIYLLLYSAFIMSIFHTLSFLRIVCILFFYYHFSLFFIFFLTFYFLLFFS